MNVLLLHQHFCIDQNIGNSRSFDWAKLLVDKGNTVSVITSSSSLHKKSFPLTYYSISGVDIHIIDVEYQHQMSFAKRKISFILFFIKSFFKILTFKNIDLVYAISSPISVGLLGLWAKKYLKAIFFFEIWDLWPDTPVQMNLIKNTFLVKLLYLVESKIYKAADKIVVLSDGMYDYLIDNKNVNKENIILSYNGTNYSIFNHHYDRQKAKINLGFEADDFLIIYSGTVGVANDLSFLTTIAQNLLQESKIKFLIVGNGNDLERIKNIIKSNHITNIHIYNTVSKTELVERYLSASNLGLVLFADFPILNTNSSTKFYDYLASNLIIGVNCIGWQKNILTKYKKGFATNFDQTADFQTYILDLMFKKCVYSDEFNGDLQQKFSRNLILGKLYEILF